MSVRRIVGDATRFFKALVFLFRHSHGFFVRGGLVVKTPIEVKRGRGATGGKLYFRTVVQPDGDIIDFVPPPDYLGKDMEWQRLYDNRYQKHRSNVRKTLGRMDGLHTIPVVIEAAVSVSVLFGLIRKIPIPQTEFWMVVVVVAFVLCTIVFVYLLQKYLGKRILSAFVRLLLRRYVYRYVGQRVKGVMTPLRGRV
jgi:hypothetical protein